MILVILLDKTVDTVDVQFQTQSLVDYHLIINDILPDTYVITIHIFLEVSK